MDHKLLALLSNMDCDDLNAEFSKCCQSDIEKLRKWAVCSYSARRSGGAEESFEVKIAEFIVFELFAEK